MEYQPFLPRGMQHVDREKLYSSLPIRVQYLQQFLDFGQGKGASNRDKVISLTLG